MPSSNKYMYSAEPEIKAPLCPKCGGELMLSGREAETYWSCGQGHIFETGPVNPQDPYGPLLVGRRISISRKEQRLLPKECLTQSCEHNGIDDCVAAAQGGNK